MTAAHHNFASADTSAWHERPQARVIFADCLNDPPRKLLHTKIFTMTADQWTAYDRDDRRIVALDALHNQAFLEAEALGGPMLKRRRCASPWIRCWTRSWMQAGSRLSWGGWRERV